MGREWGDAAAGALLDEWPVERPANWLGWVNQPQTAAEEQAVRRSIGRGQPFGTESWRRATTDRLGLLHTLNPASRPRKHPGPPA